MTKVFITLSLSYKNVKSRYKTYVALVLRVPSQLPQKPSLRVTPQKRPLEATPEAAPEKLSSKTALESHPPLGSPLRNEPPEEILSNHTSAEWQHTSKG